MRIESSVTSVSWIPSEAISGMPRSFFDVGITHYDDPLPDVLEDLGKWRDENRFRFANQLSAWIEVEGDQIVDAGYSGGGMIGVTTVKTHITALMTKTDSPNRVRLALLAHRSR